MTKEQILKQIDHDILQFKDPAGLYHPVYGLQDRYQSKTQRVCDDRCQTILTILRKIYHTDTNPYFANILNFVSVVDIGSNLGYNDLYLSNHVHSVDGYEIVRGWRDFADLIRQYNDIQNVRFFHGDIRSNISSLDFQYDVCLFLSVIHYFVQENGLEKTINFLNLLISKCDYTIIESSTHQEYDYMPENLNDIFDNLTDCIVTFVGNSEKNNRPIYLIQRTKLTLGVNQKYSYHEIRHSQSMDKQNKVYLCDNKIIKCTKNNHQKSEYFYNNERAALTTLQRYDFVPVLYEATSDGLKHVLIMERFQSTPLSFQLYHRQIKISNDNKIRLIFQLVNILDIMQSHQIFWDDIEFQNMMIVDGKLKIYDFQESTAKPTYDQRMFLYWILYDLSQDMIVSRDIPSPERGYIFNDMLHRKPKLYGFSCLNEIATLLIHSSNFKDFLDKIKSLPEYETMKLQPIAVMPKA